MVLVPLYQDLRTFICPNCFFLPCEDTAKSTIHELRWAPLDTELCQYHNMILSSFHNHENKPILHQLSSLTMLSPFCGIHLHIRVKIWHIKYLDETYLWDSLFNSEQNYKFKSSFNKSWSKTGIASEYSI